jgi:putative redox protein
MADEPTKARVIIGEAGYRTEIHIDEHIVVADEPVALGGTDLGPSPTQLLLGSLGACTAMTLRMYANQKHWPLAGVDVHLEMLETRGSEGSTTAIKREINLQGDLTAEQRERLLVLATRCPVARILSGTVNIESVLV